MLNLQSYKDCNFCSKKKGVLIHKSREVFNKLTFSRKKEAKNYQIQIFDYQFFKKIQLLKTFILREILQDVILKNILGVFLTKFD
jgi:hypothetical protein